MGVDLPFRVPEAAPLSEELAGRVEVLDAMVPGVGDIDVAIGGNGYAPGFLKLAVTLAGSAPRRGHRAIGIECSHTRATTLDHVDLAVGRNRHILGIGQHRVCVGGSTVNGAAVGG